MKRASSQASASRLSFTSVGGLRRCKGEFSYAVYEDEIRGKPEGAAQILSTSSISHFNAPAEVFYVDILINLMQRPEMHKVFLAQPNVHAHQISLHSLKKVCPTLCTPFKNDSILYNALEMIILLL